MRRGKWILVLGLSLAPAAIISDSPIHSGNDAAGSSKNTWKTLGQSTQIYAPDDFKIQEPEQRTFHLLGVRMDAYSRGFAQGDVVYLEIIRPANVFGFYSYLYDEDGKQLPLSRTNWGYRILLPIGSQDKREKIILTWKQSASDKFGTAKVELPINSKSFPQTRWYNRVSSLIPDFAPLFAGGGEDSAPVVSLDDNASAASLAPVESPETTPEGAEVQNSEEVPSGDLPSPAEEGATAPPEEEASLSDPEAHPIVEQESHAAEEEGEEQLSNFMQKISLEKSLKNQIFERKSTDLFTSRLSHPRNMHYITSQCFTSRLQITYKTVQGRRVEVGRRVVMHNGVDLRGRPGTPVFSIADGQVVLARPMHFEGNFTIIDHGLGVFSGYMHQSNLRVRVGDYVSAGQRIGDVGTTGYSTGPHLHLALWIRGVPVDPLSLLSVPIRE